MRKVRSLSDNRTEANLQCTSGNCASDRYTFLGSRRCVSDQFLANWLIAWQLGIISEHPSLRTIRVRLNVRNLIFWVRHGIFLDSRSEEKECVLSVQNGFSRKKRFFFCLGICFPEFRTQKIPRKNSSESKSGRAES